MARRMSPRMRAQQNKMKACAVDWKRKGKPGSWQNHVTRCLRSKSSR